MTDYVDETFTGGQVRLDGNSFEGCSFENTVFVYGGTPFEFKDNKVGFYVMSFDGPFAEALASLKRFGGDIGDGAPIGVAEQLAAFVRPSN